jgi:hypothetical protein
LTVEILKKGTPEVLNYRVSNSDLSKLQRLVFSEADAAWKTFTTGNRNRTIIPMHNYDTVSGAVVQNVAKGNAWTFPAFNQISVNTQKAVNTFNKGLR